MRKDILTVGLVSKTQPTTIEDLNNGQGTFHYYHNIKEVSVIEDEHGGITVTTDDDPKATGKAFQYDCVRVEFPKTGDNIFGTLVTAKYPTNTESKLVNEYQSALLGLLPESSKAPYEEFLKDRLSIRAMVDADCEANNIPTE